MAEVVLRPYQFSSFNREDSNSKLWPRKVQAGDWQAWLEIQAMIDADPPDNTGGATHYFSEGIQVPTWADPDKATVEIKPFKFFRLNN